MAININLKDLLKKRGYTIVKLSDEVGVTTANLSKLVNNKVSEVKLETLNKICKSLKCTPGDLLEYKNEEKKRIIPLFLDVFGGTDLILSSGIENTKMFFQSISQFQKEANVEIKIIMVTDVAFESTKSKYLLFNKLASSYGLPDLVCGAVCEHCGFFVSNEQITPLSTIDTRIIEKRADINEIAEEYNGFINSQFTSMYNLIFDKKTTRSQLAEIKDKLEKTINCNDIDVVTYYDSYGIECDIMNKNHSKANAVFMLAKMLKLEYDIQFIITGGAFLQVNWEMYYNNKERLKEMGYDIWFVSKNKNEEILESEYDKNVLIFDLSTCDGIKELLNRIYSGIKK